RQDPAGDPHVSREGRGREGQGGDRVPPPGRFRQAGRVRRTVSKEGQGGLRGRTPSHEFLGGHGGGQAVPYGNRRRRVQVRRFEAAAGRGLSSGQGGSSGRNLVIAMPEDVRAWFAS